MSKNATAGDPSQGVPRRYTIPLVLGAMYLPTLFGFFASCRHCRQVWLFIWPVTPGAAPVLLAQIGGRMHLPDYVLWSIAAALTAMGLLGLVRAGRCNRKCFALILGGAAILNLLTAMMIYALVRA